MRLDANRRLVLSDTQTALETSPLSAVCCVVVHPVTDKGVQIRVLSYANQAEMFLAAHALLTRVVTDFDRTHGFVADHIEAVLGALTTLDAISPRPTSHSGARQ